MSQPSRGHVTPPVAGDVRMHSVACNIDAVRSEIRATRSTTGLTRSVRRACWSPARWRYALSPWQPAAEVAPEEDIEQPKGPKTGVSWPAAIVQACLRQTFQSRASVSVAFAHVTPLGGSEASGVCLLCWCAVDKRYIHV